MSLNSRINAVRNYLASQYMYAEDEWLSGCVEYLTEDSDNNYNELEINNLAKEQWLLNDLKDICPGCLPANLKGQQKIILNGRFVLQINGAVDIGTPAYQQYLKLQKVNMENVEATTTFEDKIPNHRMIKLYLTDGVQEISAIEYRPMRNLNCDITPGCKVLIKGPVECRRGMLLLTENCIELLGGEVQEIAITNSLAGLLSSKLGVPITQETDLNATLSQPRNTNVPAPHVEMPPARLNEDSHRFNTASGQTTARVTSIDITESIDDEDIDVNELAALEAQVTGNCSKRPLNEDNPKPEKRPRVEPINNPDDYPDDNDLFLEEDYEYLRDFEAKFDAKESELKNLKDKVKVVSAEPFVYIKQINSMSNSDRAGRVFRVKGQIMKLLSKLSVGKDGWSLRCTIVDGTGSIDVDFTSTVLSKLVGFTPQEMQLLKKKMATEPEMKEKAVAALQKAKDNLQVLYCIIELTMLHVPTITCLIPFEESHVNLLKKRLQCTNL